MRKLAGAAASAYNGVYDTQSRQLMKPFVQSHVLLYIRRIIIIKHMGGSIRGMYQGSPRSHTRT
ncbi:hypothetical protein AALA00_08360 [Lachnospiraceae bacterium 46-15]